MRAWKSALPLALLGLGASLVEGMTSAENMHKLMSGSGHAHKRCPYADIQDQHAKRGLDKRILVNSLKEPVDSMYSLLTDFKRQHTHGKYQSLETTLSTLPTLRRETSVDHALVLMRWQTMLTSPVAVLCL